MNRFHKLIVIVAAFVLCPLAARAASVLQFDFTTAPSGADVTASFATGGASNIGELKDGATVNTGPTGMSYALSSALRNGYLTIGQNGSGNQPGLDTKDTGGSNNRWSSYMGTTSYGSGTAVVVFRPTYTNNGAGHAARRTLWMSGNGFNNTVWLMHHGDPPPSPAAFIENGTAFAKITPGYSYDGNGNSIADDWVMLAASWQTSPGAGEPTALVYARHITGGSTVATVKEVFNALPTGSLNDILTIGRRNDGTTNHQESAFGDFAFFRLYNDFQDRTELNSLYASLVPEPAGAGLLALVGAAALFRRR